MTARLKIFTTTHPSSMWPTRTTWRKGKRCVSFGDISTPKGTYSLMKFKQGFWEEVGATRALYKALLWLEN